MTKPTINEMVSAVSSQAREHEGSAATCYSRAKQDRLAEVLDAAAETLKRMQWQPIETAPKDGTEIDLWVSGYKGRIHRKPSCKWGTAYGDTGWLYFGRDPTESHSDTWQEIEADIVGWTAIPTGPTQDAET